MYEKKKKKKKKNEEEKESSLRTFMLLNLVCDIEKLIFWIHERFLRIKPSS
jgi:hypothetical protein